MTIYAFIPALFALVGLVLFLVAGGKWQELGKILLFTGLLAFLFVVAHHVAKIGVG